MIFFAVLIASRRFFQNLAIAFNPTNKFLDSTIRYIKNLTKFKILSEHY